jgi:signal transduction histidine kinase
MMLSTLESAKAALPDRPALGGLIARGTRSMRKIQTVVDGLLEFARAGAHPVGGVRSDLKPALEDVVQTLASSAERNLITLDAPPVPSCVVACNPGVLTSLISNLVENAIKYMGSSPVRRVTIRVQDRSPMVRVEVEDTGPGIPSELASKIFSPYIRGTQSKQPGIGLGLATVKRMAEAHGGAVGVETALDHGSTFWFELPSAGALTSENADAVGHAVGGPLRSGVSV